MGTQIHAVLGVKNRTHQYIMQTKPGLQLSCMHFVSPIPICMVARFLSLLPTPPLSLSKHIQIHVHESRTPHFDFYFTEFDFTLALAELATDRRVVFTALSLSLSLHSVSQSQIQFEISRTCFYQLGTWVLFGIEHADDAFRRFEQGEMESCFSFPFISLVISENLHSGV